MNAQNDLYVILDVARAASGGDIKRAFRRLARRFHPDINPGNRAAEERFKQISEAYEILSSAPKRRFYDENGFYADAPQSNAPPAASFRFQSFDFSGSDMQGSVDTFAEFFRSAERQGPERGEDLEHPISVSFADAIRGSKTRIVARRQTVCESCRGSGHAATRQTSCAECRGEGRIARAKGRLRFSANCAACGGSGLVWGACAGCGGEGRVAAVETLDVELPPGAGPDTRLRFEAKGNAGRHGGPAGDLFVVVNVTPHPTFTRAGDNIHCTLPITFWEAALGAKIAVPTVDGSATIRIPPGTQSGRMLRMRGLGAPSLAQPGLRGDQLVTVRVVVPRVADERSKAILKELARLNPEDPRSGMV